MFREFYETATLLELPVVAMVLFAATFLGVLVRVLTKRREHHDSLARLPLEDDAAPAYANGGHHG